MREGDVKVTDWEVTELEVDDQPAVRLDMWLWESNQVTVHLEREGDTLHPWRQEQHTGFVGLMDTEAVLAERLLERNGYELADGPWE